MRKVIAGGNIRVAGAIGDSPIGLLDDPILPQHGGTHHVVFYPFQSGIGTTTIVQRLCGAEPTSPNPSSGINGYRAVWSIEQDTVGTVRYENFFLWDVISKRVYFSENVRSKYALLEKGSSSSRIASHSLKKGPKKTCFL